MKKEVPEITIKPNYQYVYEIGSRYLISLIVVLLLTPAIITMGYFQYYIGIIVLYFAFVITMLIYRKKKSENTYYLFYKNKMVYKHTRKQQEESTIMYQNIKQIGYRETLFQKLFKTGDLLFIMSNQKFPNNRLYIWNVSKAKQQSKQIEKMIKEAKK